MFKTLKDHNKLKLAVESTECHSEYGVVMLIQRAVEMFASRTGKPIPQSHLESSFQLTTGQVELLNIVSLIFRNNL
jgi:hypothetical protein